jgi:hypothetical protein
MRMTERASVKYKDTRATKMTTCTTMRLFISQRGNGRDGERNRWDDRKEVTGMTFKREREREIRVHRSTHRQPVADEQVGCRKSQQMCERKWRRSRRRRRRRRRGTKRVPVM